MATSTDGSIIETTFSRITLHFFRCKVDIIVHLQLAFSNKSCQISEIFWIHQISVAMGGIFHNCDNCLGVTTSKFTNACDTCFVWTAGISPIFAFKIPTMARFTTVCCRAFFLGIWTWPGFMGCRRFIGTRHGVPFIIKLATPSYWRWIGCKSLGNGEWHKKCCKEHQHRTAFKIHNLFPTLKL